MGRAAGRGQEGEVLEIVPVRMREQRGHPDQEIAPHAVGYTHMLLMIIQCHQRRLRQELTTQRVQCRLCSTHGRHMRRTHGAMMSCCLSTSLQGTALAGWAPPSLTAWTRCTCWACEQSSKGESADDISCHSHINHCASGGLSLSAVAVVLTRDACGRCSCSGAGAMRMITRK